MMRPVARQALGERAPESEIGCAAEKPRSPVPASSPCGSRTARSPGFFEHQPQSGLRWRDERFELGARPGGDQGRLLRAYHVRAREATEAERISCCDQCRNRAEAHCRNPRCTSRIRRPRTGDEQLLNAMNRLDIESSITSLLPGALFRHPRVICD